MEQADNLLLRIQKYDKTFSKGQKRLAAYVLKNYDKEKNTDFEYIKSRIMEIVS